MRQVTVKSLKWHYAIMATLTAVPLLLPSILMVIAPGVPDLRPNDFWLLIVIPTPLFMMWFCLTIVPIFRPRRLILTGNGVTLDTLWRRQHWTWDCVSGVWPLGGYKPQLDVHVDGSSPRRIFLGSYWPGDTEGLAKVISDYRACRATFQAS
ncbi:hypothetical protein FHT02_002531 [Sphingomonas xinjiangensis]|uniref:PH domain-containing protein n=1 Tax=Sphingomonas xinjiangensis TaxID=643568 RepID=A0A840YD16_9SPHN|nr:hypothetical protein [Sphingomonas xinjiangensis]